MEESNHHRQVFVDMMLMRNILIEQVFSTKQHTNYFLFQR